MNLDRAIEILNAIIQTGKYEGDPDDSAAVQLGIEALMRIKEQRDYRFSHMSRLLPGETEK